MNQQTATSLKLERTLDAPAHDVYRALTSKEAIGRWFGPSDDFRVTVHEWDFRIGGRYRVQFQTPAGETHTCYGVFKTSEPDRKLAYTWAWEEGPAIDTLVTFEIEARDKKTHLTMIHDGFPAEDVRDHHVQGWTGSLERLERVIG